MSGQFRMLLAIGLATALLSLAGAAPAIAAPYSIDILINPYHPHFTSNGPPIDRSNSVWLHVA